MHSVRNGPGSSDLLTTEASVTETGYSGRLQGVVRETDRGVVMETAEQNDSIAHAENTAHQH